VIKKAGMWDAGKKGRKKRSSTQVGERDVVQRRTNNHTAQADRLQVRMPQGRHSELEHRPAVPRRSLAEPGELQRQAPHSQGAAPPAFRRQRWGTQTTDHRRSRLADRRPLRCLVQRC